MKDVKRYELWTSMLFVDFSTVPVIRSAEISDTFRNVLAPKFVGPSSAQIVCWIRPCGFCFSSLSVRFVKETSSLTKTLRCRGERACPGAWRRRRYLRGRQVVVVSFGLTLKTHSDVVRSLTGYCVCVCACVCVRSKDGPDPPRRQPAAISSYAVHTTRPNAAEGMQRWPRQPRLAAIAAIIVAKSHCPSSDDDHWLSDAAGETAKVVRSVWRFGAQLEPRQRLWPLSRPDLITRSRTFWNDIYQIKYIGYQTVSRWKRVNFGKLWFQPSTD